MHGNTDQWTLCVPISDINIIKQIKPDTAQLPEIPKEMPKASVHPFFSALNTGTELHSKHFSFPYAGTIEDPITGTEFRVKDAYIATYVKPELKGKYDLTVEQGQEIGKDGHVIVHVNSEEEI